MRAGLLRERISFQKLVSLQSPSGAVNKEYQTILECRAYRRHTAAAKDGLNALEQFTGGILVFQIRYNSQIEESMRVQYQGRAYEIILLDRQLKDNTYLVTLKRLDI